MSARVLVVDDVEANRRVLEARLAAEYYQVLNATNGEEAIASAQNNQPDIVLLDVMMPGLDGYEVCRRLKEDMTTRHIPVLMVTALDERESRLRALQAGADDYLTKPLDEVQLMARLRNLARLKPIIDELRNREASGRRIGMLVTETQADTGHGARILLVDDDPKQVRRMQTALADSHTIMLLNADGGEDASVRPDLIVVSLAAKAFDGLKVVAHMRTAEATRRLAVIAIAEGDDRMRAVRALDLGADDVVFRPLDMDEMGARVRTLVKRKRYIDAMSSALDRGLEAAVVDPLTGLHNRRYLTAKLDPLIKRSANGGGPLSLLILDIDHFKAINDTHGHDGGDAVLRQFSDRVSGMIRPLDLFCRYGGEEFVIVMPGTTGDLAALAAERLRRRIASSTFTVQPGVRPPVTTSIGVATVVDGDTPESVMKRADEALYHAKNDGRNRVKGA